MADKLEKEGEWVLVIHHDAYACPNCGAVVSANFRRRHDTWHKNLELALEQKAEEK